MTASLLLSPQAGSSLCTCGVHAAPGAWEEADSRDGSGTKELPLVGGTGAVNLDSINEYESLGTAANSFWLEQKLTN